MEAVSSLGIEVRYLIAGSNPVRLQQEMIIMAEALEKRKLEKDKKVMLTKNRHLKAHINDILNVVVKYN